MMPPNTISISSRRDTLVPSAEMEKPEANFRDYNRASLA